MNKTSKLVSLLLALCLLLTLAPAYAEETPEHDTYTYHTYATSLGNNWNPHTWETSADDTIQSYLSSPFCTMSILDSEEGVYQWIYEMATEITDVTAENREDLTKYNVALKAGDTAETAEEGYVFEIKLNPEAKWEDGTPINADTYIYSMKQLLDPDMKNYRANLYYAGESAVAGGADYYYGGSIAYIDNGANDAYTLADLTAGEDGTFVTPAGEPVYIALMDGLDWLGGNTLSDYVDAYGEAYFGVEDYNALKEIADEKGRVPANEETIKLIQGVITAVADWGETEDDCINYMVIAREYPRADYDSTVGCYKVDDYTIHYVNAQYIDINYFLTSCTSTWLVYEPLYEAGKDTSGELVTTNYCTSMETSMSYGPYKLASLQPDKQIVFVQNENWYGWEEQEDGSLISYTNFEVDGEQVQQYQTTSVVIDVMDDAAAQQAFLKGELSEWTPTPDDLLAYATSEQL